jgi:hypothetical protein
MKSSPGILKNMKKSVGSGIKSGMDISEMPSPLPPENTMTAGSWRTVLPGFDNSQSRIAISACFH